MRTWSSRIATRRPSARIAALLAVSGALAGCAAPARRADVPLGTWVGNGTFVYESWEKTESGEASEPRSVQRSYSTRLKIRSGALAGQDVIEVEILSERGPLPKLEDRTHLRAALREAKRPTDSLALYQVLGAQFNPGPDEALKPLDDAPPFAASACDAGDAMILQIQYAENFVDFFRFSGDRVEKYGTYFDPEKGMITWYEWLGRQR
ncbi:MAG: hypothetical protein AB7Q17_03845 [Phycisphaerae bacterium]